MKRLAIWIIVAGCGSSASPTPTEAVCPSPDPMSLTYDNFGEAFMGSYCTACHDSSLPRSQRNGAPLFHDFDTLIGVVEVIDHIDEEAGSGPAASNDFMPPSRCPSTKGGPADIACPTPTEQERKDLALWLACEGERPH